MRKHLWLGITVLSLAATGCSLAPSYQRPAVSVPGGWTPAAGVAVTPERAATPFWQDLDSAELNRLIDRALAENLDLEAALHRIDQARAQAKIAGAPLYPAIGASGVRCRFPANCRRQSVAAFMCVSASSERTGMRSSTAVSGREAIVSPPVNAPPPGDVKQAVAEKDRQRAEVKGLGPHQKTNQTFEYSMQWRTNPEFVGINRFCHIFQLKATDGDNGAPLVRFSGRVRDVRP